jgi:heme-degrading monooxygenase HmoA
MVVVLIRTVLHPEADRAAYEALDAQMYALAQTMPGFIAADGYTASDGGTISLVRFESLDTLRAWREHPDHLVAQQRGKTEFFASYTVEVCEVVRAYDFTR